MGPLPQGRVPSHNHEHVLDDAKARLEQAPRVRLQNVFYRYGAQEVLDEVNFEVADGELVALLGPSGCGKSTLIRLLAGLLVPQQGSRQLHPSAQALEVGLCFQESRLLPWRSCLENVALPLEPKVKDRGQRLAKAKEMLDLVGLAKAQSRLPHELSGGMKMRVAVARALVNTPKLLLLDEPFAALDAPSRLELQALLHRLCQATSLSVVLVTHSLQEAARLADRACIMASDPGRVVQELHFESAASTRMDTRNESFARALIAVQRGMQRAVEASA